MDRLYQEQFDEILQKELEIISSMLNADVQRLDDLIHDDMMFIIPGGHVITKSMDIESYRSKKMILNSIKIDDLKMRFVDDNALVSCTAYMKGVYLSEPFDGKFKILRVWKKVDGHWRIISGSSQIIQS